MKQQHLVIGADSFVGKSLTQELIALGYTVYATTRRKDTVTALRPYLDFTDLESFVCPSAVTHVHVVACATGYEQCAANGQASFINTVAIPALMQRLLLEGRRVNFVSSNSVFGGSIPWPHEESPKAAGFPYAQQKELAETYIIDTAREHGVEGQLGIVRLTKVLGIRTPPLPAWLETWKAGQVVRPFTDLIFAPISLRFAGHALAVIGEKSLPGIFHVSGAENISYQELALALAAALDVPAQKVEPTTADAQGVHIPFKPRYSGLGMSCTTTLTGLLPQTLCSVVDDILQQVQSI